MIDIKQNPIKKLEKLEKLLKDTKEEYKKKQIEIKIYEHKRRYFPKYFYKSSVLGTYRKKDSNV